MKKTLSLLLSVIIIFSISITAFAVDNPSIYSDAVYTTLNESFTVPIKLKNNAGLMGFRITVKYPDSQIKLKDISSGSLTKSGLFNTTVTDYYSVKGSFDVLWSNSADVKGDGTLVMLTFETLGYADYGAHKIEIGYSQDDTFNEKWEGVTLDCKAVNINITDAKSASKKNEVSTKAQPQNGEAVSDDYLIASVKAILDSYQILDISDVMDDAQKENILKFVNSRNLSYSQKAVQYKTFDELKAAYNKALKNEAVVNVLESADGDKIIELADRILKEHGAKNFSELSDSDKEKAVGEVLNGISSQGGDTQVFARIADTDNAADVIDEIVNGAKEEKENALNVGNKSAEKSKTNIIVIIVASVFLIAAIVITLIYIKKKAKKNEEEK